MVGSGSRRQLAALGALATFASAACSGNSDSPEPPSDSAPPFATHELVADDPSPEAQIKGTLELIDGCLTVSGHPVVLPAGTTWDAASQTIVIGSRTSGVGSEVHWGGGYGSARPSDLPGTCPPGEVATVHTTS